MHAASVPCPPLLDRTARGLLLWLSSLWVKRQHSWKMEFESLDGNRAAESIAQCD